MDVAVFSCILQENSLTTSTDSQTLISKFGSLRSKFDNSDSKFDVFWAKVWGFPAGKFDV